MPHPDQIQLARLRDGDDRGFAALYAKYRAPLVRYAERTLGSRADAAEDLVQEAFMRAHRSLRDPERDIAVGPWLYRIVRNACIDELRRPAVEVEVEAETLERSPARDDAHEIAVRREHLREVVRDVAALPERQRDALVVHIFAGVSHEQAARRRGGTPGANKSLVSRARTSLARSRREREAPAALRAAA